ncbi:unnamed protein product [Caenorhabditis angaria]|uniref:Uncharacterized protein n=1 Tax=Caenorhabditis angaria TaxID=860376 RepID=A0A9P1N6X9_9PELO|nr:unnamed protein product [Caenorhabditis angaria]
MKRFDAVELGETSSSYFETSFTDSRPCQKDVRGHTGCVNSISLSKNQQYLSSGGDDMHTYIWRVNDMMVERNPKPRAIMKTLHESNIFATEISNDNRTVYSGGRDDVVYRHDIETGECLKTDIDVTQHIDKNVHCIKQCRSNDNTISITRGSIVVTCDTRCNDKVLICKSPRDTFHNSDFNPDTWYLFLTCSLEEGPLIYDLRNLKKPVNEGERRFYGERFFSHFEKYPKNTYSKWSPSGKSFASLQSRHSPIYYDLNARVNHICKDEDYMNVHTMKSMAFLNERTIVTGSDEGTIFIWNVDEVENSDSPGDCDYFETKTINRSTKKLVGHRSIPNQIRYCESSQVIFSSGVENSIKLWSMKTLPYSYDEPFIRRKRDDYITVEMEIEREQRERKEIEDAIGKEGMEGRATWDDVFGGNPMTSESRDTCELFDAHVSQRHFFLDHSDDDDSIEMHLENIRRRLIGVSDDSDESDSDASSNSEPVNRRRRIMANILNELLDEFMDFDAEEDEAGEDDFDDIDEDDDDNESINNEGGDEDADSDSDGEDDIFDEESD